MISLLNELGAAASRAGASMLMQTVALAVALLVVELITGRRLRATLRCALWLLVVAKLLLPPGFALPTGVAYWVGPWLVSPVRVSDPWVASVSVSAVDVGIPAVDLPHEPAAILATTGQPRVRVSAGLGLAWLGGTAVMLGVIFRRNREVRRLVRDSDPASPAHQQALQEAAGRIGLRRLPELRMTRHEHSPAVCGLLRPIVLLPGTLASALSPSALQDVLLHELIHVQRRDLWMNLPQTLALVLWWWNPVIWLAQSRIRSLREQAVDERVMTVREGDPESYPATLLEVARHCAARPTLALSFVGILESNGALRSRVERLLSSPVPRRAHLGAGGWIAVILAALLFLPMAFARRVEPVVPAPSNPPPLKREAVYVMDPELARRYGLVPATDASPVEPITNFYGMDPVLARRYGLIPAETDSNSPVSPELMRRYGLVPETNVVQVQLDSKVVRMNAALARRYGLIPATNASPVEPATTPYRMDPVLARRYGLIPPQVQLEVRFVEVDPAASLQIESDQLSLNTESQTLTAVLTPSQFDRMIQGLEAHPGTKVLATPKVSTLSGRAAQISMVQETPSVNRRTGDTQKLPIGPVLDVTPQVLVEPPTIRLTLAAQLHQVTDEADPDTGAPQVLTHEFAATVPALDGHTVVLFADASGRDLASASAKRARRILVFVTPVIVDPAGNRVNPPGE